MTPGDFGEFAGSEQFMEEFTTSLGTSLLSTTWSSILGIVAYILMAVGMYTIANRRGIKNAWLAWIPFGSTWLLGCISDQYRYVVMGQEKSKRKVMLGLEIATSVMLTVVGVVLIATVVSMITSIGSTSHMEEAAVSALVPLMVALVVCFVMLGVAIAYTVLYYMALHDLFKSCSPENATMFLVLGIFLGNILLAIFVFASRKKDLGMPPRQDQVVYAQPVFQPQPPQQPPVWQPQQPPVEPWEQNNE